MDLKYTYNKDSLISLYDYNFNKKLYFEYEITNNLINYKETNKKRYIVPKDDLLNVLYLFDTNKEEIKDGFVYFNNVGKIILIPVGENIYLLASYNSPIYNVKTLLYTFMKDYDCVIDVSKYTHLFNKEELTTLKLYKKLKTK